MATKRFTREPTAATVPEPSMPSRRGNFGRPGMFHFPSRAIASHTPTPADFTLINTSLGPTSGIGNSCTSIFEGPPKERTTAAFIVVGSAMPGVVTTRA